MKLPTFLSIFVLNAYHKKSVFVFLKKALCFRVCSGLNGGPPARYIRILEPVGLILLRKRVFADAAKDLNDSILDYPSGP